MKDNAANSSEKPKKSFWGKTWNVITGNAFTTALSITTAALAVTAAVATGGAAVIVAAVAAGAATTAKAAQVTVQTVKAANNNALQDKNDALIEYAQALYLQQTVLKLEPKLEVVKSQLYQPTEGKLSSSIQHTPNTKTARAENIINTISFGIDIAAVIIQPEKILSVASVADGTVTGVIDGTISAVSRTADGVSGVVDIVAACKKSPALQEELVNRINTELKRQDVSFDNLTELRGQVRRLNVENKALQATLQEKNFYSMDETAISTKFVEKYTQYNKEVEGIAKEAGAVKRTFEALGNTFNPFHERETKQHSGLTAGFRKQQIEDQPLVQERVTTQDDINIGKQTKYKDNEVLTDKGRAMDDISLGQAKATKSYSSNDQDKPKEQVIAEFKKWQTENNNKMQAKVNNNDDIKIATSSTIQANKPDGKAR